MLKCENNQHTRVLSESRLEHGLMALSWKHIQAHTSWFCFWLTNFSFLWWRVAVCHLRIKAEHALCSICMFSLYHPCFKEQGFSREGWDSQADWQVQDIWWYLLHILQSSHLSVLRAPALPTSKASRIWLLNSGMSLSIRIGIIMSFISIVVSNSIHSFIMYS